MLKMKAPNYNLLHFSTCNIPQLLGAPRLRPASAHSLLTIVVVMKLFTTANFFKGPLAAPV